MLQGREGVSIRRQICGRRYVPTANLNPAFRVSLTNVCTTDNTNADQEVRSKWVAIAKEYKVPIRCVFFKAEATLCEHNNVVRALNQDVSSRVPGFCADSSDDPVRILRKARTGWNTDRGL